jgi:hypothetical protein
LMTESNLTSSRHIHPCERAIDPCARMWIGAPSGNARSPKRRHLDVQRMFSPTTSLFGYHFRVLGQLMSGVFIPLAQWITSWSRQGGAARRASECGHLQGAQDRSSRPTVALAGHACRRFSPSCPAPGPLPDRSNRGREQPPAGGSSPLLPLSDGRVCQRPSRDAASAQGNRQGRLAKPRQPLINAPTVPEVK